MATLSPLRYAGAKNRLLPILMPHITKLVKNETIFADAFSGGGSVSLAVAESFPSLKILLNDKDPHISSLYSIIVNSNDFDFNTFINMINIKPTVELFKHWKGIIPSSEIEYAFKLLFINRCSFSGLFTKNSNPIGSYSQNSKYTVDCRYNSDKLIKKIKAIRELLQDRLTIYNLDINDFLLKVGDIPMYLDPPYLKKGKDLYNIFMTEKEHLTLSQNLINHKKWLLSYDSCDEIKKMYVNCDINVIDANYSINGFKSSWIKKEELLILPK